MATTAGGENPVGSIEYNNLFAVGMLLFVITLVLNLLSISFVRRFRQVY
jgi:ABC-type phosphate transport system permease subunit